ncbi:hypothetical protein B0H17DRAFT_1133260 [Mycena rosella]|uniref:Uncharacterized protein n=1 Tax=Mycena rosella TaxID=1033263 RepID=A0AAD7DIT4_MYCRO|nr:hypothetical protein B0H17DRAFT_1133260 [Mycena rosella]
MSKFLASKLFFDSRRRCLSARFPTLPHCSRAFPTHLRRITQAASSSNRFDAKDTRTWYKASIPLPEPWSCDWHHPDGRDLHDTLERWSEGIRVFWGVMGPIQPLAFIPDATPDPVFFFVADAEYYFFNYNELVRFPGPFASHDDFLGQLDKQFLKRGTEVQLIDLEPDEGRDVTVDAER